MNERIQLLGRITVRAELRAATGLSIGAGEAGLVPGLDRNVLRDSLRGEPYIPGSSLKGKLRALTERALGLPLSTVPAGAGRRDLRGAHRCASENEYRGRGGVPGYAGCPVCHLYGIAADGFTVFPTRLITRDAPLTEASRAELSRRRTELPFTEVKTESALDRLTAAASPRLRERVPAGAAFEARWDLALYAVDGEDLHDEKLLAVLLAGLALLEDDYLGGMGSRGYGRVQAAGLQASLSHDGGISSGARELLEQLSGKGTVAEALEATGNPLRR